MSSPPLYLDGAACPALRAAFDYSMRHMQALETLFSANAESLSAILTIAVAGSLGRYEAHSASDVDCIIVLRDDATPRQQQEQLALVQELFASTPFQPPKADGIYRRGIAPRQLLAPAALGSLDEAPEVFGKRIQFLLDAQAVFAHDHHRTLQRAIIDWYASDFLHAKPSRAWTYLCNDLTRYLHSYAGWQQFKFTRSSDDSWQLRQAKFRSSRLVTFAATLFLLGESDRRADKLTWLHAQLPLPPLARLHAVMARYDEPAFHALLEAYDACCGALAEPRVRERLIASGPDAERRMAVEFDAAYEALRESSARIVEVLTEFALARRAEWGTRFFSRWLF